MTRHFGPWIDLGLQTWMLGFESAAVIGLRMTKAAMGKLADHEARLMVDEKVKAAVELQTAFMLGGLGADPARAATRVVRSYTRKARANRRRLTRAA